MVKKLSLLLILGVFCLSTSYGQCSNSVVTALKNANKINVQNNGTKIIFKNWTNLASFTPHGRFVVPSCITEIVINGGVTVTGNFYSTTTGGKLTIRGNNRTTSKIRGTKWNNNNYQRGPVKGEEADKNAAIYSKNRELEVRNLTSNYPNKFHILGRKKVTALDLDLIAVPGGGANPGSNWHTTDGIGGADNSVIKRCKIDTYDDALKVYYNNMVIEDVTVYWNQNGAPLQMGWGNSSFYSFGSAKIKNFEVIKRGNSHNQGCISWAGGIFTSGNKGKRTLTFTGTNIFPNVNKVIQFGAGPQVNYVELTMKGTWSCNLQGWVQNRIYKKNVVNNSTAKVFFNGCNSNSLSVADEPLVNDKISVYPNPAQGLIKLSNLKSEQEYAIYNLSGQQVLKGQTSETINISNLQSGYYIIRLADGALKALSFVKK